MLQLGIGAKGSTFLGGSQEPPEIVDVVDLVDEVDGRGRTRRFALCNSSFKIHHSSFGGSAAGGLPQPEAQHVGEGFESFCFCVANAMAGFVIGEEEYGFAGGGRFL